MPFGPYAKQVPCELGKLEMTGRVGAELEEAQENKELWK